MADYKQEEVVSAHDSTRHQGATIPVEQTQASYAPSAIRRVSWGAIFGGAVIALVVQLALNLLGLAIGLGAIDPATESNPLGGIGTGTGIWLALSTIIALFTGGWAAGRMAGLPRRIDGMLHGGVAWAVVTLFTFYMIATGIGTVLSGAMNIVQQGAQLVGQGVAAAVPAAAGAVDGDISFSELQAEVEQILRQTDQEALQPENLAARAQAATETAQGAAADAASTPEDAEQEIRQALDNLVREGREVIQEADREAAVNVLMARTDMSRAEARNTVDQYANVVDQARGQVSQTAQNIGEQTVETTDQVIASMSSAALWAFIAMVVGAVSAAAGGAAGAPANMPASPAVRRE